MRRVMWTAVCIGLIAAGVILRFAIGAGSRHGLDVHTAGVIAIGAGELGLLPLLIWGPLNPAWRHRRHPQSRRPTPPEDRRVGHQ